MTNRIVYTQELHTGRAIQLVEMVGTDQERRADELVKAVKTLGLIAWSSREVTK